MTGEELMNQSHEEGCDQALRLASALIRDGRLEELEQCHDDKAVLAELLKEYHL